MTLAISGLNHHTSPVDVRERLAFSGDALPKALYQLKNRFPEGGVVVLSTCNRVEIYVHAVEPAEQIHQAVRQFFSEFHDVPEEEFAEYLYEYDDRGVVAHLFRVASSLDSLVVGEDQIIGQVHDAYLIAQAEDVTDKLISGLFQRAFKVAKEVHTKSNIHVGKVSVASVAVELAVSIFTGLSDKVVMVIGSGETGELALKSLVEQGVEKVIVVNRTLSSAETLAAQFRGEAVALEHLNDHLHLADIIISSTASPEPVLRVEDFKRALKKRSQEPMFAIDIAVPRDIEAGVDQLDNIYLYDIDGLQEVADQNMEARRAEMEYCLQIVDSSVDKFMKWRQGLMAEPTIVSMAQEFHTIRERELAKTLNAMETLTEEQRGEIEYLTKRIVNNILQRPMTQLKHEVTQEDPHTVLHLMKRLFGLEET